MMPTPHQQTDIVPIPPAATLSLDQSAQLTRDFTFQGRVKSAAIIYAQYLTLQPSNSASRMRWIQQTMSQPDQMAQQLVSPVVYNPNVQQAGSVIDDASLQAAVQVVADTLM